MPGDSLVQDPFEVTTRAITINSWPGHVWRWLAQMGKGRGGLHSVRARLPRTWKLPLQFAALDPSEFLMVRRQLMGIRDGAERLARADSAYVRAASQ